jgi:transcriptional regulator with PAS, ATPase and Fis domain
VRQLENVVERAMTFSQGRPQIDVGDLAPEVQEADPIVVNEVWFPDEGIDFERYIGDQELALIRRALDRTRGNKRQAAQLLKLKRTTLIEKLKRLDPPAAQDAPKVP